MKYVLNKDDALIRITLVCENGNYNFEILDFQDPMGRIGCDPLNEVIRRNASEGYRSLIYIRIPRGGNAASGISEEAKGKRKKAIFSAERKLLRDEIKRLGAQDQKARKLIAGILKIEKGGQKNADIR